MNRLSGMGSQDDQRGTDASSVGILSWGAYIPRLRSERRAAVEANGWANGALAGRAAGTRSFCNWDEDVVTMGVEAGRACLARQTLPADRLVFASTTAPFQDRPAATVAAAALRLSPDAHTLDHGNSQRAGSSALLDALRQTATSLVLAADTRVAGTATVQEIAYGDAAAAMLTGSGEVVARFLGGVSRNEDFVDHFRAAGVAKELHWEERWVRDEGIGRLVPHTIKALLEQTGVAPAEIRHFICPTPFAKFNEQMAAKLGIASETVRDDLAAAVGDSGVAHSLVMLAATLDVASAGDKILLAHFGSGCDALLLEATPLLARQQGAAGVSEQVARGVIESSYQKFLSFKGGVHIDFGLRFEAEVRTALTAQYRRGRDMAGFLAGCCAKCGTVQFPRAGVCVNPRCDHLGEQTSVSLLGDKGQIVSFTSDWLSFKGAPPFCFGLVQFESGARVLMEFVDFPLQSLAVGAPVRLVYRRKEVDTLRHYHSYFWKAAPAAD